MSLNRNSRFDIMVALGRAALPRTTGRRGCPLPHCRAARDADRPATLPEPTVRRRMRCGPLRLQRPLCRSRRCRNDEQRWEGSRRLPSSVAAAARGNVRMDESLEDRLFVRVWLPGPRKTSLYASLKRTGARVRLVSTFISTAANGDPSLRALDCWQVSYAPHAVLLCSRLAQAASNHCCEVLHI